MASHLGPHCLSEYIGKHGSFAYALAQSEQVLHSVYNKNPYGIEASLIDFELDYGPRIHYFASRRPVIVDIALTF